MLPGSTDLFSLLDKYLQNFEEGSVLAITSKIVSICEGRFIKTSEVDKEELLKRESDFYLPGSASKYGHHFSIVNNTLVGMAGIDASNGAGHYILWPSDAQRVANEVRGYLISRFGIERTGVIITDSTSTPFRMGATGVALSHSGFKALKDYVGTPDLFGRPFEVSRANISGGLAATATLAMGEGTEQSPLCIIGDLSFVEFQQRDPTPEEVKEMHIPMEDDLFAPFLTSIDWLPGSKHAKD
jgi:F420-0:gamma-glutamyl ligase